MEQISSLFLNDDFLIDEKVQVFKMSNEYKIFNAVSEEIGAVDQKLSFGGKIARLMLNKAMLPFELHIEDTQDNCLVKIKRGFTLWTSKIQILDKDDNLLGGISQKFQLFKPKFEVTDAQGDKIGEITGDWKAWNFVIKDKNEVEIGTVNKKWAGAMKELFTTADKYHVHINPDHAEDMSKVILLSAAITIDMVLKESK